MTYKRWLPGYVMYFIPVIITDLTLLLAVTDPIITTYFLVFVNLAVMTLYNTFRALMAEAACAVTAWDIAIAVRMYGSRTISSTSIGRPGSMPKASVMTASATAMSSIMTSRFVRTFDNMYETGDTGVLNTRA